MWYVVIIIVVILIFAAVTLYAGNKTWSSTFSTIDSEKLQGSRDACIAEMQTKTPKPTDKDLDGFADNTKKSGVWCDLCLGGDDALDDDGDGVPDDCDKTPDTPFDKKSSFEKECTNWNKDTKRCTPS